MPRFVDDRRKNHRRRRRKARHCVRCRRLRHCDRRRPPECRRNRHHRYHRRSDTALPTLIVLVNSPASLKPPGHRRSDIVRKVDRAKRSKFCRIRHRPRPHRPRIDVMTLVRRRSRSSRPSPLTSPAAGYQDRPNLIVDGLADDFEAAGSRSQHRPGLLLQTLRPFAPNIDIRPHRRPDPPSSVVVVRADNEVRDTVAVHVAGGRYRTAGIIKTTASPLIRKPPVPSCRYRSRFIDRRQISMSMPKIDKCRTGSPSPRFHCRRRRSPDRRSHRHLHRRPIASTENPDRSPEGISDDT